MAPVQTSYSETMQKALAGMVADMTTYDAVTRIVATAAGIGFGLAVSDSTGRKDAILGGSLAAFLGCSMRDPTVPPADDADEYEQYANMGVLTMGHIWVLPGASVARTDPVNFNATTGVFSNTGGQGPILGARWEEAGNTATLAKLYLPGYRS